MLCHGKGQQQSYKMARDTTNANFMLGNYGDVKEITRDVKEIMAMWRMETMGGMLMKWWWMGKWLGMI